MLESQDIEETDAEKSQGVSISAEQEPRLEVTPPKPEKQNDWSTE